MPRTLPWLTEKAAAKAAAKTATATAKAAVTSPPVSPRDLVGPDLEDVEEELPDKRKKTPHREPSSSPPPVVREPPPQEEMRPGYAADDGWMMVEDEFYSTAQLFTQHLHQEAYAQLKKLHKSRGQETLAALARGTDGRTAQSKQLQLKLQAEENAKKRKQAMARDSGSEDEDEYMLDPQLAGLMTGSQSQRGPNVSRLTQARARKSLAEDGDDSSDPLSEPDLSLVVEEEEGEEDEATDSDDLGRPPRKQLPVAKASTAVSRARESIPPAPRLFRQFAKTRVEEREPGQADSAASYLPSSPPPRLSAPTRTRPETVARPRPRSPSPQRGRTFTSRIPALVKEERSSSPVNPPPPPVQLKTPTFLARRRAQKIKEEADAKRKEIEDGIPMFLV